MLWTKPGEVDGIVYGLRDRPSTATTPARRLVYPTSLSDTAIDRIDELIADALGRPWILPADTALLRKPDLHPLAKLETVQKVLAGDDALSPSDVALLELRYTDDALTEAQRLHEAHAEGVKQMADAITGVAKALALEPYGGWSDRFQLQQGTYTGVLRSGLMGDGSLVPADFETVVPEAAAPAAPASAMADVDARIRAEQATWPIPEGGAQIQTRGGARAPWVSRGTFPTREAANEWMSQQSTGSRIDPTTASSPSGVPSSASAHPRQHRSRRPLPQSRCHPARTGARPPSRRASSTGA